MDNQNNQNIENKDNIIPQAPEKRMHTGISCIAACAMLVYISVFCTVPLGDLFGFAVFAGFAIVYSSLVSSGSFVGTLLPPFAGLAAVMLSTHFDGGFGYATGMQFFNVPIGVAMGFALHICNTKRARKSVVFATVSAFGTLSLLIAVAAAVFVSYGELSADILAKAISDIANTVGNTYKEILSTAVADAGQNAELTQMIESVGDGMALSIELNFVSMLTVYGMMFGAFTVIIYRPLTRLMGCEGQIFKERAWVFSLSGVSAVFFEIIFTVYIFSALFCDNIVILGAFINLVNVLVYPFGYVGVKYVYGLLKARLSSGLYAALIIAAAALVAAFVTGLNTFVMVAALVGASSVFKDGINPKGNGSDDQI